METCVQCGDVFDHDFTEGNCEDCGWGPFCLRCFNPEDHDCDSLLTRDEEYQRDWVQSDYV